MKIRLKGKQINTSIIMCYAPTNDGDEEIKDMFYEQLQAELEDTPRHDLKIVMGDMNAKVGNDNANYNRAMGKEGYGVMNENGERLLELCTTYNLVIGGTLFPHKDIHKLTWHSPNGRDRNQIDHLMINGTWRRSLRDIRVYRGADVGSDHHLVVAILKIKLRKAGIRKIGRQQIDLEKLNDPKVKNAFVLQLKNRFQALADLDGYTQTDAEEVNNRWEHAKKAYIETSMNFLGTVQKKKKEWLTA